MGVERRWPLDGADVFLRAMAIRDANEAWRQILRGFDWEVVLQLAADVIRHGDVVPEFVWVYLGCDSIDELKARRAGVGAGLERADCG